MSDDDVFVKQSENKITEESSIPLSSLQKLIKDFHGNYTKKFKIIYLSTQHLRASQKRRIFAPQNFYYEKQVSNASFKSHQISLLINTNGLNR